MEFLLQRDIFANRASIMGMGSWGTEMAGALVITNVFAGPQHTDVDDTVVSIPVTRAIGTFPSANVHKPTAVVQVTTTTSATQSPSTPAKLLQLVSTPSIPSPQLTTNLTTSDKLFDRRPSGSAVLSTTSLNVSGTGSTFVDVTETPTSTVHPYRYALLIGSADGKRYLVLGSQGLFEKNSAGSLYFNVSDEALTEQTEAIDALQSQTELP
ncbi:unnamed protein product, partial [Echinostoma caproni]|uniref:Serine protease n=1 Tax=Echinostoma caproni TaxID=27848 RepID=A0A183BFW5_9TREM